MAIQWFPGHMTSARKKASEAMEFNDVIIEVLDARLPEASSNPLIKELRMHRQRPCLKLLNKADLADPVVTQQWLDFYNKQPGVKAVAISCKKAGEVARIPAYCKPLAPHRNDRIKPLRMMIMGIPNVGKSTLMNALLKRKVAKVGDEPAVTKHAQRLELSPTAVLTDTPGLMWPKIAHDTDGYMLAASHAIGRNAVDEETVAFVLANILLERYPKYLADRYKIDVTGFDGVAMIEAVARKRGCIIRGRDRAGELDLEKAAMVFLQDYRDGNLGQVSLETPASRAAMVAAALAAAAAAQKAAETPSGDTRRKLQVELDAQSQAAQDQALPDDLSDAGRDDRA